MLLPPSLKNLCINSVFPTLQPGQRELTVTAARLRSMSTGSESVLKLGGWKKNTADGDYTAGCIFTVRSNKHQHKTHIK